MTIVELENALCAGLRQLALPLPPNAAEKLLTFCELIQKWNRVYNLTAIHQPAKMLTHHIFDSLAVLPALTDIQYLADIGSGAGLPGLVLAIARPDMHILSVEKVAKKTAFQQQVKTILQLDNVHIANCRVQSLRPEQQPDAVISRAFSSLCDFVQSAAPLLGEKGIFFAMKGVYPAQEISELPPTARLQGSVQLSVPGLEAERHLIILESVHG